MTDKLNDFKQLNYKATKANVLRVVKRYDMALSKIGSKSRPKINQTYSIDMPSFTNSFHSSTEDAALYHAEGVKKDIAYVERVISCLNSMREDLRILMWESYFEGTQDNYLADQLKMSVPNLSLKKREAVEIFAYGMSCEVY